MTQRQYEPNIFPGAFLISRDEERYYVVMLAKGLIQVYCMHDKTVAYLGADDVRELVNAGLVNEPVMQRLRKRVANFLAEINTIKDIFERVAEIKPPEAITTAQALADWIFSRHPAMQSTIRARLYLFFADCDRGAQPELARFIIDHFPDDHDHFQLRLRAKDKLEVEVSPDEALAGTPG